MPRRDIESLIADLDTLVEIEDYAEYEAARADLATRGEEVLRAHRRTRNFGAEFPDELTSYRRADPSERDEAACQKQMDEIREQQDYWNGLREKLVRCARPIPILLFLHAALVLGGLAMIGYWLVYPALQTRSASRWPTVKGRVLSSEVSSHTTTSHGERASPRRGSQRRGNYDFHSSGSESTIYHLDIKYEYEVDSKKYTGTRLSFERPSEEHSDWSAKALKYRSGSKVTVHYNPDKPSEAVLELEYATGGAPTPALFGFALVLVGGFLLFRAHRWNTH